MPKVVLDAEHAGIQLADMEAAAAEFIAWLQSYPEAWNRGPAGKWTAGQHAEHLAIMHALTADLYDAAADAYEAGKLPPVPRRGLIEKLGVHLLAQSKKFPRGGRAIPRAEPGSELDPTTTIARLRTEVARYRPLVARLGRVGLERVWINNPFIKLKWHYRLPETMRVHAQHTRHHALLAREGVGS